MQKIFKSLLLLIPLIFLSACNEVDGYVTNKYGEPVENVYISLKELDENGTEKGYIANNIRTDSLGYYSTSFSTDYPIVEIITNHSVGDGTNSKETFTEFNITDESSYRVDIVIDESYIVPDYRLTGTINDENGSAIKGAGIKLDDIFDFSDENGSYSLPMIQNEYTLLIKKEGYVTYYEDFNYTDGIAHTRNFILKKVQ